MYNLINRIELYLNYLKTLIYYRLFFKGVGYKSVIHAPLKLVNPERIIIGSKTIIEKGATLYCITQFSESTYSGEIVIGDNVYINHHVNITAANRVEIHDDVLMAYNINIFDNDHDYQNIDCNINKTALKVRGPIVIGEKSWIGMNVSILGKVTIGKHCIVGANSLVVQDIPDYCVALGNPAKVIKRYNLMTRQWEKV